MSSSLRLASKQFPIFTLAAFFFTLWLAPPSSAQQQDSHAATRPHTTEPVATRSIVTQPINESRLTVLRGNTHPWARPQFDLGTAPASLPMQRMLLVLKRSPERDSALEKLLDDQQNKSSPSYHQWLTPDQYGQQFGPSDADLQAIIAWLESHGFQVGATKGRTVLEFSGSAGQVQDAFHTSIHNYVVNGEQYWANASDPSIPAALAPAVAGVASLNNFPRRPMNHFVGRFARDKATGKIAAINPQYTFPSGCQESNTSDSPCSYGLGPYDFATIYNVLPLWTANINGTGQTIAIVGESNINPQDVANFRSLFGLPPNSTTTGNPLNIILNGPDPGIQGDESEADIDVQWSGAVAPNATIDFVVSQTTETTSGVDLSAVYIVDNNLAPVMSESYGLCELGVGTAGNQFYNTLWQQAAAQGITVFIAAGDNGAAGCDDFNAQSPAPAEFGLQVSGYASTPYNVAVGGTDFNDFSNPQTYWSTTNNPTTQASALGYIPETTWNSSCTNAIFVTLGYDSTSEAVCNDSRVTPYFVVPLGGSGGASNCTTPSGETSASCAGGYAKPSWQTGTGVPPDGKRDLPDVALFASSGFLGSFYIICQSDQTGGACDLSNETFLGFGGTSVSSPAFAGIMALVNQQTGSRQGNANYVFYKLAAKDTLASCNSSSKPASTCIFNDVTSGTNAMPCAAGSPNCTTSAGDQYGILTGYNAGTGYDQATGLGSVNANNLVTQWSSVASLPSTTTLNSLTPTTITHGQPVNFSVTVTPQSGTGTPTGQISLQGGTGGTTPASTAFNLSNGTASGTTNLLPGGTYSVTAHYPGDSTYAASNSSPISVTVNKENSQPQVFLVTYDSNGNLISGNTNTAAYGSPYVLRVNVENSAGAVCAPVSTTAATACPSGTVAMTINGATLDAGTYTLNSYGNFEDLTVQLPGGTDSIKAAYAGDNSFNASSVTTPISITLAATTVSTPSFPGTVSAGQATVISVNIATTSSGVAPTGTVTFNANGSALPGTVAYSPVAGGTTASASLGAVLTTTANAFPIAGNYAVTATYSGDTNYAVSTSLPDNITIQFPRPGMSLTPVSQTVTSGSTATLTTLVDSNSQSVYPTGTVTLSSNSVSGPVAGPIPCTSTKDGSGNYSCQGTFTFTPSATISVFSTYSGDTNYPGQTSSPAQVNIPDFALSPGAGQVTITQGQAQTVAINVAALSGFTGVVSSFSCTPSSLPAETTCGFNPAQVTGSGSTTLTITTTPLGQLRQRASSSEAAIWSKASEVVFLLGICLIGIPFSKRRHSKLPVLLMIALLIALPSCGGGSGGGGGTVTNNPVPSISSLSPTQLAAGSAGQTLTIKGSGFVSASSVTFNGVAHAATFVNAGQVSIQLTPADIASAGTFPVIVTNPSPGGGPSGSVDFAVVTGTPTGNFTVTVTASSGTVTHNTSFTLQVQ
jgi:subtilase family serine protease